MAWEDEGVTLTPPTHVHFHVDSAHFDVFHHELHCLFPLLWCFFRYICLFILQHLLWTGSRNWSTSRKLSNL